MNDNPLTTRQWRKKWGFETLGQKISKDGQTWYIWVNVRADRVPWYLYWIMETNEWVFQGLEYELPARAKRVEEWLDHVGFEPEEGNDK